MENEGAGLDVPTCFPALGRLLPAAKPKAVTRASWGFGESQVRWGRGSEQQPGPHPKREERKRRGKGRRRKKRREGENDQPTSIQGAEL